MMHIIGVGGAKEVKHTFTGLNEDRHSFLASGCDQWGGVHPPNDPWWPSTPLDGRGKDDSPCRHPQDSSHTGLREASPAVQE